MKELAFKVYDMDFVNESEAVFKADILPDPFDVEIEIEEDAADWEIERAIKLEVDEYLESVGRSDVRLYQFSYEQY